MFDRYTDPARRALFFARFEASLFGSTSIETEHLLLGVLRASNGIAARLFAGANLTYKDARDEIGERVGAKKKVSISVEIPFSSEVIRSLQATAEEADRMLQSTIGPEHLLMGLAREERSMAGTILAAHGLILDVIRTRAIELSREEKARVDETRGADPRGDYSVGWSIEFAQAHQYRALNEHLDRMSHLLVQIAGAASQRDRVLELIQALQFELHSLREFLGPLRGDEGSES